jgi:phosphatidylinositol kinase/protein kinase (PI-3  family)
MEDPFKESWNQTQVKLRKHSEYASYKTFALKMMIVKANDDLRQEYLAMQLMKRLQ